MRKFATLLALLAVATSFAQQNQTSPRPQDPPKTTVSAKEKEEVLAKVNDIMANAAFVPGVDFKVWPEHLAKQKAELEKAESSRDFMLAINKALSTFGTSHIVMSTPQAASNRMQKRNVGIGIQIQPEAGKGIRVLAIFPGSPAEEAKLKPGDLIVKANGKMVDNPVDMQGEEGTTLELEIQRENRTIKLKATRRPYSNVRPEELTWADKETAVIKIFTFDVNYSRDNVEKLMKGAAGAKRLVVDLRSNGGGAVINMIHFLSMVMPEGSYAGAFLSRKDVDKYVEATGGKPTDFANIAKQSVTQLKIRRNKNVESFKGKIAVLINGGSGSAAEITAAALSEELNAPVIGSRSAGAVLASIMGPLPHGFMLQYPIMDYVSPRGVRLEGNGVSPLLEANPIVAYGAKDEALEKAILLLARMERLGS